MNDIVILLTACVNPNGMAFTKLQDSTEREAQYRRALEWYLENTDFRIVFVENTDTDFSSDFSGYIESGRLEYITFDGNNYDRKLGKGYGEAKLIERAFQDSAFIRDSEYIIKITGRLILENVNAIAKKSKPGYVYTNTELVDGKIRSLSYVFSSPKTFLPEYFLPHIGKLNDSEGYYFEHLLYEAIVEWRKDGKNSSEFPLPLKITGQSGTSGTAYGKTTALSGIKAVLRCLLFNNGIYLNHIRPREYQC